MTKTLRVGLIGASVDRGWARDSHAPAIQALTGLEPAVATNTQETADAAARTFGAISAAYGDGLQLIRDPAVDLVAIAVKVPGTGTWRRWQPEGMCTANSRSAGIPKIVGDSGAGGGGWLAHRHGLQTRLDPAARQAS